MSIGLYALLAEHHYDSFAAPDDPQEMHVPDEVRHLGMAARCAPQGERAAGCLFAGAARPSLTPHVLSYVVPAGGSLDFAASLCEQAGTRVPETQRLAWAADGGRLGPRCLKFLAGLVAREQPIVLLPADLPLGAGLNRRDLVDLPQTSAFLPAEAARGGGSSMVGHPVVLVTGDVRGGRVFAVGVVKDPALLNDVGFTCLRDGEHRLLVPCQLIAAFEDVGESADERAAYLARTVPGVVTAADDSLHAALPPPFALWASNEELTGCLLDPMLATSALSASLDVSLVPQRVLCLARMAIASPEFLGFLPFAGPVGQCLAANFAAARAPLPAPLRSHARKHTTAALLEHVARRTASRDYAHPGLCASLQRLQLPK